MSQYANCFLSGMVISGKKNQCAVVLIHPSARSATKKPEARYACSFWHPVTLPLKAKFIGGSHDENLVAVHSDSASDLFLNYIKEAVHSEEVRNSLTIEKVLWAVGFSPRIEEFISDFESDQYNILKNSQKVLIDLDLYDYVVSKEKNEQSTIDGMKYYFSSLKSIQKEKITNPIYWVEEKVYWDKLFKKGEYSKEVCDACATSERISSLGGDLNGFDTPSLFKVINPFYKKFLENEKLVNNDLIEGLNSSFAELFAINDFLFTLGKTWAPQSYENSEDESKKIEKFYDQVLKARSRN